MRNLAWTVSVTVSVLTAGCATAHRTAGENCCLIAAGVGAAAVVGLAGSAIDSVLDPEPRVDGSVESQRRHFDWKQRQIEEAYD